MKNVKLNLWNVAELNVLTHNNVKGWNSRFNKRMNRHHPNMWAFVTCLQNEEVNFRQQVLKVLTGTQKMKTKTLALQAKINTRTKRFEDDDIDRTEFSSLFYIVLRQINC
jgi:hypothetical protein